MSATMAGAAIIAACRGAVDEQEEGLLRKAMSEADLLRHMDSERALKQFRKFASSPDVGRPEGSVYSMLDRCKELKGGSRIVHAIALGMTGVHGAPTQDELRALDRICERIGVENTRPLQPNNGEGHG